MYTSADYKHEDNVIVRYLNELREQLYLKLPFVVDAVPLIRVKTSHFIHNRQSEIKLYEHDIAVAQY